MHTPESIYAGKELRVIPLGGSEHDAILMPHNLRLPKGTMTQTESLESAARRISTERINQEFMTSVARLGPVDDVHGYVVEAATGKPADLRAGFAVRAFQLDYLLKDAGDNPDKYDATDISLLQSFFDKDFRK